MNCKNTNKEMGFDKFSECNYNLHWSFSNFNRNLIIAKQIADLPAGSVILEIGAGSSPLEDIVITNFKRHDIQFLKIDGDEQYQQSKSVFVFDITADDFDKVCQTSHLRFNAIIFAEVVEHIDKRLASKIFKRISDWLVPEGLLFFTTPTPPREGLYEDRVWPTDHEQEFTRSEIYSIINKWFKINKEIGWSLEEREYNKLLETNANLSLIASKLRNAFPESYIRALISCLSPVEDNRQILFICKKRRIANGRSTQA